MDRNTILRTLCTVFLLIAVSVSGFAAPANGDQSYVELDRAKFQKEIDGKHVDLYTIKNNKGMIVRITNYGARVEQIVVPDRTGKLGDVALGYESIDQVVNGQGSMNAFVGRYANRIAKGKFTLDGKQYQLAINNPPNTLHGGEKGSRFVVFDAKQLNDSSVQMTYIYKDGEENFPGTLMSRVVYSVTDDNSLVISYDAVAVDKPTVVNFTSHIFFNLAGQGNGDILGHELMISSDRITPVDATLITTGEFRSVTGTPMDFREPKAIGSRINQDYDQLKYGPGYDVNYVLNKTGSELSLAARVREPKTGRVLEVFTTEPGVQFYSGNFLDGTLTGKQGHVYKLRYGFCLETQHYPDSPNEPSFPSTILRPGQTYHSTTVYKFSTR